MNILIALTMVCGFAFAFAACGGAATTQTTEAAVDSVAVTDTLAIDSLDSAIADSTGAM